MDAAEKSLGQADLDIQLEYVVGVFQRPAG